MISSLFSVFSPNIDKEGQESSPEQSLCVDDSHEDWVVISNDSPRSNNSSAPRGLVEYVQPKSKTNPTMDKHQLEEALYVRLLIPLRYKHTLICLGQ